MSANTAWTNKELDGIRALDVEVSKLVSKYLGGPWPQEQPFVPTQENLDAVNSEIASASKKVSSLEDRFWREHLTAALESLAFQIECNTKMPYEHITRLSSVLDRLLGRSGAQPAADRALEISSKLAGIEAVVDAVDTLVSTRGAALAKSQLADVLPALLKNLQRAVDFVSEHAGSAGVKSDGERAGAKAMAAVKRVLSKVRSIPVAEMDRVDIPFEVSVEKGMQAPLSYILSWYEEDAKKRREEYFRIAEEMFPGQDPAVVEKGGGYDSIDALFKDMRRILDHLQAECRRFVDLPEGEYCEIGLIPETWRMMVPGFMYMNGFVAINPDNLGSYSRVGLETTAAHEVYPGHHVHSVKSAKNALPYTFRLPLFWSRCLQEGMCDRSMCLMTPYFKEPAARLSVAKRLWFTSNRVKSEVDIYYNKKPIKAIIDNYMTNLGLPEYNAHAQTRAHLMRPADAISYYTGMKYLDDLYKERGGDLKAFTNEVFSYGQIPLNTQKNILSLTPAKKEQLRTFTANSTVNFTPEEG